MSSTRRFSPGHDAAEKGTPVPHVVVMGAGSLGLLFGGMITTAKNVRVTVVGRAHHVDAIRAAGLRIIGADGSVRQVDPLAFRAVTDPEETVGHVDFALVATKRHDLETAVRQLSSMRDRITTVFSLQNGVDHDEVISEALGASRVLRALTMEGAATVQAGVVKHLLQSMTYVGELDGKRSHRAVDLVGLLNRGGLRAELTADIQTAQWTKFVQSCAASGVCGVSRRGYAAATATEAGASLYVRLVKEGSAVMQASGLTPGRFFTEAATVADVARLAPDQAVELVRGIAAGLIDRGYTGSTSLARDLDLGRPSENDALLGTMCRIAARHSVDVPTMEAVYLAIQATEDATR